VGGTPLRIEQETDYPWRGEVLLRLKPARAAEFTLKIRIPHRGESELYTVRPDPVGAFELKVNGEVQSGPVENGYVSVRRTWNAGDRVELSLPMDVQRIYADPRVTADRGRVALQRGPMVYSVEDVDNGGDARSLVLGPGVSLRAAWEEDLLGGVMAIRGDGIMAVPNFARQNRGGWSQVWIVEDPETAVPARGVPHGSERTVREGVESRTVDRVVIGDAASEKAHDLRGERTVSGRFKARPWRHSGNGGWFSYLLEVDPAAKNSVSCTYWGSDGGNRRFDIVVEGERVGSQVLDNNHSGKFFDVEYALPADLVRGKSAVTVRIQAKPGATAGGVFDLRVLRVE
jgi:hypothetical protein